MDKTRLMAAALLSAGMLSVVAFRPAAETDDATLDQRDEWERFSATCASASLRMSSGPEPDFDAREGNTVADFWTSDIPGLYVLKSGPECDSAADCASTRLAREERAPEVNPRVPDRVAVQRDELSADEDGGPEARP